jgi:hypothetical protein
VSRALEQLRLAQIVRRVPLEKLAARELERAIEVSSGPEVDVVTDVAYP